MDQTDGCLTPIVTKSDPPMNVPSSIAPASVETLSRRGRSRFPGLAQWVCGGIVVAALTGLSLPVFSETVARSRRLKSLAQAKQIGIALKLFSGDNDGVYPSHGTPQVLKKPTTSNAAFATLFPAYLESELIFGDELSVYQTRKPDNIIDPTYTGKPVKTLEPGENVYAYMMGLTDASNASSPLVFDGTDGTGYYTADATQRGGVGNGVEVIVIRVDCSGLLEPLAGPPNLRFVPLGKKMADSLKADPDDNLLDAKLYGQDVRLLEPAVDPSGKR